MQAQTLRTIGRWLPRPRGSPWCRAATVIEGAQLTCPSSRVVLSPRSIPAAEPTWLPKWPSSARVPSPLRLRITWGCVALAAIVGQVGVEEIGRAMAPPVRDVRRPLGQPRTRLPRGDGRPKGCRRHRHPRLPRPTALDAACDPPRGTVSSCRAGARQRVTCGVDKESSKRAGNGPDLEQAGPPGIAGSHRSKTGRVPWPPAEAANRASATPQQPVRITSPQPADHHEC